MNIDWETERLLIKRTKEEDFEELGPMLLDYKVAKFLQKTYIQLNTINSAKIFFTDFLYNGIISFTIKIKNTNKMIGQIGYPYESDNMTIFYWIGSNYQGKGFATEASLQLTNYIFRKSYKKLLKIPFHIENEKSAKLAKKIGDFLLKENPNWKLLDKEDEIEIYEVFNIDDFSVKLKLENSNECEIVDKLMFPDEFLKIGEKIPIHLKFIVISKTI